MFAKYRAALLLSLMFLFSTVLYGQAQAERTEPGTAQPSQPGKVESVSEIESLRLQLKEQQEEIRKLREELGYESDQRKRQQPMIESLITKITDLTARLDEIRAVKTAPVSAPAATGADTQRTAGTAQSQADKPANVVETGLGKVKFTGFVQAWFSAGDKGIADSFRIRRAELRFTGDLLPKVRWSVMFDPAKLLSLNTTSTTVNGTPVVRSIGVNQSSRVFQEAFITLSHMKRANIQFGQFKIPLSQEGLQSTSTLDTVERALFMSDRSRGGGLGDSRDIGLMVFGPLTRQFDYQVGVFNGTGESQNDVDANDQKAFVGRFVFKPRAIKGLSVGTSGAWAPSTATLNPQHHRLGFESVYQKDKLRLKSEFMLGIDGDVHRRGYYAHLGYRLFPKIEGVFRFDTFDPNTRLDSTAATAAERDYIGGINYYIKEHNFKVQFNYIRKTFANPIVPSRNLFIVNMQTAW